MLDAEHLLLGILVVSPDTVRRFAAPDWPPERLEQVFDDEGIAGDLLRKADVTAAKINQTLK